MAASPTEEREVTEAAREGVWEGTAVGTSSVSPEMTGSPGREKTGAVAGREDAAGRLDEGEGAAARAVAVCPEGAESLTVVSAKASISSIEDCVICAAGAET